MQFPDKEFDHLKQKDTTEYLRSIFDLFPDYIFYKDINCRFIIANLKVVELMQAASHEELVGKTDFDFYPPDMARKFYENDQMIIKSKKAALNIEEVNYNVAGEKMYISMSKIPLINENNVVIGLYGIGRDITALRQAQLAVKENEVRVAHETGKYEIATDVLHNIGNVLNSVNVSVINVQHVMEKSKLPGLQKANELLSHHQHDLADFIANDEKGKVIPKYLKTLELELLNEKKKVQDEIKSLQNKVDVIKNILNIQQKMARVNAHDEENRLEEIIDFAHTILSRSLLKRDIKVIKDLDGSLRVKGIRSKLIHVFVNLLKNAMESLVVSGTSDKHIKIRSYPEKDKIIVEIEDNGRGIKKDMLKEIFKFGVTTRDEGYGFGLHACANTMNEIDGKISAVSEGEGKGAKFILTFKR
jgi:PAS domain S-box-containing protein